MGILETMKQNYNYHKEQQRQRKLVEIKDPINVKHSCYFIFLFSEGEGGKKKDNNRCRASL